MCEARKSAQQLPSNNQVQFVCMIALCAGGTSGQEKLQRRPTADTLLRTKIFVSDVKNILNNKRLIVRRFVRGEIKKIFVNHFSSRS